jgi:signal peptidase II
MERSSASQAVGRGAALRLFATALCVVVLDQVVKAVVVSTLTSGLPVDFIGTVVRFTRTTNTGAAFGLLRGQGPWFIVVSAAAAIAITVFRREIAKLRNRDQVAYGLILGGAIGNLIDRVRLGAVIDFIDIGIRDLRWPSFNVADSAISIGVVILAVGFVLLPRARDAASDAGNELPDADHAGSARWEER